MQSRLDSRGICRHGNGICRAAQKLDSLYCEAHTCPKCLQDKSSRFPFCLKHINQHLKQDEQPQAVGPIQAFLDVQPHILRRADVIGDIEKLYANKIITEKERQRNLENYKQQMDSLFAWCPVPTSTSQIPNSSKVPIEVRDYEMVNKFTYDLVTKKWLSCVAIVKIQNTPFSMGNIREAYYMTDYTKPDGSNLYVAKLSMSDEDTSTYFADVQMQCICTHLAKAYNKAGVPKKVKFVDAFIIERIEKPGRPIMGCERYLPGKYTKYSNNNGYVSPEVKNTPHAFSHFTYCFTQKNLLVTDIQGVDEIYTDPQVHTKTGTGFGVGNCGLRGIQRFFQTHRCNRICVMLGLSKTVEAAGGTQAPYKLGDITLTTTPSAEDLKFLGITKREFDYLADAFKDADSDGNGVLSVVEIAKICNKLLKKDASQLSHHLLHLIDTDHNGSVTFKEFLTWWTGVDDRF